MPKIDPGHPTAGPYQFGKGAPVPIPLLAYEGKAVTGYKKAHRTIKKDCDPEYVLIELRISARAHAQQSKGKKCRASSAKVISIKPLIPKKPSSVQYWEHKLDPTKRPLKVARSSHNRGFKYRVGETVRPTHKYDTSIYECSDGIHFFLTAEEAMDYHLF